MKTPIRMLVFSFLFLTGMNFVHAQFCVVSVSPSTIVCMGDCTTLNAMFQSSPPCSGNVSYTWSPSSGLSNPNISNPVSCITASTSYTVVACCLSTGCCDTAFITVTVNPNPVVSVSGNTMICTGQCATLCASGGVYYSWNPAGQTTACITACPTVTTTYTVIVTDANGCTNSGNVTVTVNPLPVVTVSGSGTICTGQSATLCVSGGIFSYSWNTGPTTSCIVVSPTVTTTYSVTVTDANGCTNAAMVTVTVVSCTGVAENNFSNQINIYPNPFTESTIIRINDAQLIPSEFKMYDLLGKEIKSFRIQNSETRIARDKLSDGLYYYKLLKNDKTIDKGKILIE